MQIAIIGAGVVGCAIAHELSQNPKLSIFVLEKNKGIGEEITSRNSGVVHSGLYYNPNSLKARLCVEGQELLYEWCKKKNVSNQKTGKLVIAQKNEENLLENLRTNAVACGVQKESLEVLNSKALREHYPYINGEMGLFVAKTGIVDAHELCRSFYVSATEKGALFAFHCEVREIKNKGHYVIQTTRSEIEADIVINSAGLYADKIASLAGINKYKIYPWRGDYFKIKLPYKVDKLIYPIKRPSEPGLGVHVTLDLQGRYFLGPDIEPALDAADYSEKPEKLESFYQSATRLLKDVKKDMLSYETCGIRPKLRAFDEKEEKDFVVSEDLPRFINLVGIESPGLTASYALARHVSKMISKVLVT